MPIPAWAAAAALALSAPALAAEDACPQVGDARTLARCALSRSELVLAARQELEGARGSRLTAGYALPANPTLDLFAGHRRIEGGGEDIDLGLVLSQRLEIAGQRGARLDVASVEESAAAMGLEIAEREVVIEVLAAAASLRRARATQRFADEAREASDRLSEVAAARAKEGVGSDLDAEIAQAAGVQARRDQVSAAKAVWNAEGGLARLIGSDVRLGPGTESLPAFQPGAPLEELENRAVLQRREPLLARAEGKAAEARLDLLRRERIPDVTLGVAVKHEEFSNVFGGVLGVPLPLFRRNQGEIVAQRARISRAEVAATQSDLLVRLEVRAAYQSWQLADAVVKEMPPGLEERLSQESQNLQEAYERGWMPLPTALVSLREAFSARRNLADARIEALLASLELARATGSPVLIDPEQP